MELFEDGDGFGLSQNPPAEQWLGPNTSNTWSIFSDFCCQNQDGCLCTVVQVKAMPIPWYVPVGS